LQRLRNSDDPKIEVSAVKSLFVTAVASAAMILSGGSNIDAVSIGSAFADEDAQSLPPAQVVVVRAKNACFSEAIHVTGFLVARKQAVVTLDAPGYQISEVLAAEGEQVKSGQALARLTRENGEEAQPNSPASMTLKSPVAGIVMRSSAVVGATASSLRQEPLFLIAVDNEIELEAEVPSIHLPALSPGQRARVLMDDNRELSGTVRRVPSTVDRSSQLGEARISLELVSGLRVGMFARATIDADRSCGISVPRSAVMYQTGGTSVQVVRGDVVETRAVRVGFHSDTEAEIRSGVQEGDMVVASAGSSLRNGDKVTPIISNSIRSELP
jgi:multidrug efflux pump subunit AcrA (membrane-fusion protein)